MIKKAITKILTSYFCWFKPIEISITRTFFWSPENLSFWESAIYIKNLTNISCSNVYAYIASTLHLCLGLNHVLIYSLKLGNEFSGFIFDDSLFHIFGSKNLKFWVPDLLVLIPLFKMTLCLILGFSLNENIFSYIEGCFHLGS